jgi:hypothetical protein
MVSSAGLEERIDPQISQITQIKEATAASICVGFPAFRTGKMRLRSGLIAALTQLICVICVICGLFSPRLNPCNLRMASAGLEERIDPQISQITQLEEATAASTCVGFPTFRTCKMRLRSG